MAFLDNSGDIILDAVLTDEGRKRLAAADGTFTIDKFALADDEIDYGKYNSNNILGSAYYDLDILTTPILEAYTNNATSMKSFLISITQTDLLYLPIIMLNTIADNRQTYGTSGQYYVAVNSDTAQQLQNESISVGILNGHNVGDSNNGIRLDQGMDAPELGSTMAINAALLEEQYVVEMDSRFGGITNPAGQLAQVNFVDDDKIASFFLTMGGSTGFISNLPIDNTGNVHQGQVILGPRGTSLQLKIQATSDLQTNDYLFTTLGSTTVIGSTTYRSIDSTIKIYGANTGYRIDVPIKYIKKQ